MIMFLLACGGASPVSLTLGGANDDGSGFLALTGDRDLVAQMLSDDFESAAMPSFMCPTPIGVQVYDQTIELKLELEDDRGALAEASAQIIPRCAEDDDFCRRICGG